MGGVFDYEQVARERISKMAWDYYDSGALDEITLRRNRTAYEQIQMLPRMLRGVARRSAEAKVLGRAVKAPLFVAPMAFQRLAHDEGEKATAEAAARLGLGMVLSTLSTVDAHTVAQAAGESPKWFQLYVHRDRGLTRELIARAEDAGFEALCVTVDAPLLGRRERDESNAFALPEGMDLAVLAGLSGERVAAAGEGSGLFSYFLEQIDPSLDWDDLAWLSSVSSLPIIPKGILHPEDARLAADMGAPALVVSNHGGRQLDTAVATIEALPGVTAAVANRNVEVLVDGGIRRGSDIVKALARGAQGVLIGRPVLWGLAAGGSEGVRRVLEILTGELDLAMALSGVQSIGDINKSLLVGEN